MSLLSDQSQFLLSKESMPYIIAEIGVNHEGSIDKAKELIDLAKEGGAHAAKFQSYKASSLASKDSPSYWDISKEPTKSQYDLFKKYDSFSLGLYAILFLILTLAIQQVLPIWLFTISNPVEQV